MLPETKILIEFKKQLLLFFDELITQFPREGDLVMVRLFIANQIPIKSVMDIFNHKINTNNQELREMIRSRNEVFFLEHNLFDSLGKNKVTHFKRMWRSGDCDDELKESIWKWIDAFVYLTDLYTKSINK